MFLALIRWRCAAVFAGLFLLGAIGCSEPVREDRTIEFSRDGGQVMFQHGDEGVYVADPVRGGVTKIFQPSEQVIATSRPLPSLTDGRMIFTTAEPLDKNWEKLAKLDPMVPADGRIVPQIPTRVTCWLRESPTSSEPPSDQPAEVKELFQTTCGHAGYVSAGLVAKWSPDGKKITYIRALDAALTQHSVFEFDVQSGESRQVFPHSGAAVLCDWTPGGTYLVCLVANSVDAFHQVSAASSDAGVWVGIPGQDDSWWQVPGSQYLSSGELPSLIEMLRASRPAWTQDDATFVFVSCARAHSVPDLYRLHRVDVATRSISTIAQANDRFSDLYWSPDDARFGFVEHSAEQGAVIRILEPSGILTTPPIGKPVRKFAGFDSSGNRFAYVVAAPLENVAEPQSLFLLPDPLARDSVWVGDVNEKGPGTEVFSGMRVTFPLWSPTEPRLSLWLTFTPRYHSLPTLLWRWGLLPGDPAATFDVNTKDITWLAVTPQEELQIGHYCLLKGDNEGAWRWYSQARKKLPDTKPPRGWQDFVRRLSSPENSLLFESICLRRLGRHEEADRKHLEFETSFFPATEATAAPKDSQDFMEAALNANLAPQNAEFLRQLVHDLYVAEVYLSVDAHQEGLDDFLSPLSSSASDAAMLSRSIVAAQLLLIGGDETKYLHHCTDVVAPQILRMWRPNQAEQAGIPPNLVLQVAGGLCLAPLFRPEFMRRVEEQDVRRIVPIWNALRQQKPDDHCELAIDLVLRAAALRLDDATELEATQQRLANNPAAKEFFQGDKIDQKIDGLFEFAKGYSRQR